MPTKNLSHLIGQLGQCLAHWREASDTVESSLDTDESKAVSSNTTTAQEQVCLGSQPSHGVSANPQTPATRNAGDNQSAHDISQQSLALSLCNDLLSMVGPDLVEASLARVISRGGNTSSSLHRLVGPSSTTHNSTQSEADSKATGTTPSSEESGSSSETPNKRKRSEPHEPPDARPALRSKHQQGSDDPKTISFEAVYQNGNASVKHKIVQFPDKTGKWYIILCQLHGVYFKGNPFLGAGSHLTSKLHKCRSREPAQIIRHLGVEVVDCTRELADKHNSSVLRAYRNGYQHPSSQDASREAEPSRQPRRPRGARDQGGRSRRQLKHGPGITEPIPGEVYLAYWAMSKDWSAILLLPNTGLDRLGISGSLESLGLMESVPECYEHEEGQILGWKDGYEPDGRLASRRQFPVMYFDGQEFPERSAVGWAVATDLQLFDVEAANESLIPHYKSVREFLREREERNAGSPSREIQVGPNIEFTVYEESEEEPPGSTLPPPSDDDDAQDDPVAGLDGQVLRERAEDWNPSDISDICSSAGEEMEDVVYSSPVRTENIKSGNNNLVVSNDQVAEDSDEDVSMSGVSIIDSPQLTAHTIHQTLYPPLALEANLPTVATSCSAAEEAQPLPPTNQAASPSPQTIKGITFHAAAAVPCSTAEKTPPPPIQRASSPVVAVPRSTSEDSFFSAVQEAPSPAAVAIASSIPENLPSPTAREDISPKFEQGTAAIGKVSSSPTPEAASPTLVSITRSSPEGVYYPAPQEATTIVPTTATCPSREEILSFGAEECISGFQAPPSVRAETPRLETDEDSVFDSDVLEVSVPVQAPGFEIEQHSTPNSDRITPTRSRLQSVSSETSMSVADISQLEPRHYKEPPPSTFVASSIACLAEKVFETMHQQNQYASHHGPSEHCGAGGVTSDAVRSTGAGTASGALEPEMPRIQPTDICTSTETLPGDVRQPVSPAVQAAPVSYYNPSTPPSTSHSYVRVEPRPAQPSPRLRLAPIQTPPMHRSPMSNSLMKHSIMQHSIMQPPPIPPQHTPIQNLPESVYTSQKLAPMTSPPLVSAPFQVRPTDRPMPLHPSLGGRVPSQPDVQITNNPSGPEYPASPLPPMVTTHEETLPPADIPPLNWEPEVVSSSPSLAFMNSSNSPPQAQAQVQARAQTRTNQAKIKSESKARARAKAQVQAQGQGHAHYHPQGQAQAHPHYPQGQTQGYSHPQTHIQAAFVAVPSQSVIMAQIKEQSLHSDDEIFPTGLAENPMKGRRRNFRPLFVWPDDVPAALVDFCVRHLQSRGLHPGPVGFANDFVSYNCHFCPDAKGWYVAGAFLRHLKRRHGPGCDKAII